MSAPKSYIIIGAGIGGLAIGALLAKAGNAVTIYEQHAIPGGRAGLLKKDGFIFDTGPSWYLMPEVFAHFFDLLGENITDHLDLVRLDPTYKVFFEHSPALTVHTSLERDAATFNTIEPGAGDALTRYVTQAEHTYKLAMRHFLYTNFEDKTKLLHPQILKNVPQLLGSLGTPIHRHVSRFVHDQRLQQILEYPMVFLGTSPFDAPAMYSLMSYLDFKQGVYYPKGGMYTIIQALTKIARKNGVDIQYHSPVQAITTYNGHATGITFADGSSKTADVIISNADLHFTETSLLPLPAQTYPESYWKKQMPSPSALLMYLGVKGKLPQLEHHNLFFADDWRRNFDAIYQDKMWPHPASMYVCKPSQTDATVAPKGHENIFVLVPVPAKTGVTDVKKHAKQYIAQLAAAANIPDFATRIVSQTMYGPDDFAAQMHAWNGTGLGLAHTLTQSAFFRPANKSKKLDNLFYVGANTVPGIGLPMCLIGAEVLYKRFAGDRTAGPRSTL